jgi:membrane protein DedA with SNARE-associated domain
MTAKKSPQVWFFIILLAALAVWGVLLAVGAFLGGPPSLARHFDIRKPLIVLACVGLFVGLWGWALFSRHKRLARESANAAEEARAMSGGHQPAEPGPRK